MFATPCFITSATAFQVCAAGAGNFGGVVPSPVSIVALGTSMWKPITVAMVPDRRPDICATN